MSRRIGLGGERALVVLAVPLTMGVAAAWFSACGDDRERIKPSVVADAAAEVDSSMPDTRDATLDTGRPDAPDGSDAAESIDALDAEITETADEADAAEVDDAPDCIPMDTSEAEVPEGGAVGGACNCPALSKSTFSVGDACSVTVAGWPDEGHDHVTSDTPVIYCTVPPNSGPHYGFWAAFRSYDKPFPYGYFVHSMEHGAVVILYKCAKSSDCPTVATALQSIIDARPIDPLCIDPDAGDADTDPSLPKRRIILMPDPTLDVPVAATAWGWTYRAGCVDAKSLNDFIDAHYAKALEDFCFDGIVPP